MAPAAETGQSYVIKAGELAALNYLAGNHPRPASAEWINRGTDQKLRRTTVDLLLRTFYQEPVSPSVARVRDSTGLRLTFRTDRERNQFASAFSDACKTEAVQDRSLLVAMFDDRKSAQVAVAELKQSGIPDRAVSLLLRAGHFMEPGSQWPEGHSMLSIAKAIAGGGLATALLGVGILAVPGVGGLALAGTVAVASGTVGATGAAIAKMLTDLDVDDIATKFFEQQVRSGKVFVTVDLRSTPGRREQVCSTLRRNGGHVDDSSGADPDMPVLLTAA